MTRSLVMTLLSLAACIVACTRMMPEEACRDDKSGAPPHEVASGSYRLRAGANDLRGRRDTIWQTVTVDRVAGTVTFTRSADGGQPEELQFRIQSSYIQTL